MISVAYGPMMCTPRISAVAPNRGLAVSEEWKFSSLDGIAGLARRTLGQADRSHLRLAVGRIGDARLFDRRHLLLAGDLRDTGNAFHRRGVRQLRHSGD